jgi:3-dehydroquinate dehydratase-2
MVVSRLIYVINGPNLNLLGKRQPEIYGHETLADVERDCQALAKTLGLEVAFHQNNFEGGVIEIIHEARTKSAGVIINAGAYTHTSIGIHDALKALDVPVVEVHISNIHQREEFRHHSYISLVASGVIVGCGTQGYQLALQRMARLLEAKK